MDKETALAFLQKHQPMPPDKDIVTDLIKTYDAVRRYFIEYPAIDAVPLFLNSFGEGSGFGIYQLVDEVLNKFDTETVVPYLIDALCSQTRSIRYWAADIAAQFPHTTLIKPLQEIVRNGDIDERIAAITALFGITDDRVNVILNEALLLETDPNLREQIEDAISYRRLAR